MSPAMARQLLIKYKSPENETGNRSAMAPKPSSGTASRMPSQQLKYLKSMLEMIRPPPIDLNLCRPLNDGFHYIFNVWIF